MADLPAAVRNNPQTYDYALGRVLRVAGLPNGTALCSQLLCVLTESQLATIESAAKEVAMLANYYLIEAQRLRRRAELAQRTYAELRGDTYPEEVR